MDLPEVPKITNSVIIVKYMGDYHSYASQNICVWDAPVAYYFCETVDVNVVPPSLATGLLNSWYYVPVKL